KRVKAEASNGRTWELFDLSKDWTQNNLVFSFKSDGPGLGKGGKGTITIDGAEAASGTFPNNIPFALEASETFDIGSDT
ncbi:hypothetical protein ACC719_36645, partial [Rhizobium ruizarguesonis]